MVKKSYTESIIEGHTLVIQEENGKALEATLKPFYNGGGVKANFKLDVKKRYLRVKDGHVYTIAFLFVGYEPKKASSWQMVSMNHAREKPMFEFTTSGGRQRLFSEEYLLEENSKAKNY